MHALTYTVSGYTGWDIFLGLLPLKTQARIVACAWMKSLTPPHGEPPDPTKTPMIVQFAKGSFRIVDWSGKVEPCPMEHHRI